MNRRNFLRVGGLSATALFINKNNLLAALAADSYTFKVLRNNVGIYANRGGTIGWLISDDALLVVDSQFPATAKELMKEIRKKTSRNIDILFNTHHHGDHTSGNSYLTKFTDNIVANTNCVRLQKKRNKPKKPGDKIVTANVTFEKDWNYSLGNENVTAYHLTNAHTGGDAVLHFTNSNVVHMGDLVFNGVYPYVNKEDEAMLSGWIVFIDDAINRFDNDSIFIFGHSYSPDKVYGNKTDLTNMRNYLEALLNFVRKEIAAGKTDEKILTNNYVPGFDHIKPMWDGAFQINLKAAITEVRGE